jgi:rhodanese-related sulfurtransferase
MNTRIKGFLAALSILLLLVLSAQAQYIVISADQLQERMQSGKRPMIIDVRPREEYLSGHVPAAINIPAEKMSTEHRRLPKDKNTSLVFYCRGAG